MKEHRGDRIKSCMVLYCCFLLVICSLNAPMPVGEWDDYTVPIASLLNDHNLTVSQEDVQVYAEVFPDWAGRLDTVSLSGFMDRAGHGELPWYFPVYAILCLPLVLMLKLLALPTIYAFPFTNLALLMVALGYVYDKIETDATSRCLLVALLAINPIVFYLSWGSGEVYVYSMLAIGATCWYNGWKHRAALFVSLAGMLNPTIMVVGIFMILQYLYGLVGSRDKAVGWPEYLKGNLRPLVVYGSCYIIGLVPMIYNFYHTGYINLTAAYDISFEGPESIPARFVAYLLDLNYGIIAYYPILFLLAVGVIFKAIAKKQYSCLIWPAAFLVNVYLYSVMMHINCGMSGIARYNAWSSVLLIFFVSLYGKELLGAKALKVMQCALCLGVILTGMIILRFNPFMAENTGGYVYMTPVAGWVLDNLPWAYNPLFSTFNSRVSHKDGAYKFAEEAPIVYRGQDGYVRKILASSAQKDELLDKYISGSGADEWLQGKIGELDAKLQYISIPGKYEVAPLYELGRPLVFGKEGYNAGDYLLTEMYGSEPEGAWTKGKKFSLGLAVRSDCKTLTGTIECDVYRYKCDTYNGTQEVIIFANGEEVLREKDFEGGRLSFAFANPGNGKQIKIDIKLPDAISPARFGSNDNRTLGLYIKTMKLNETDI